MFNKKISISDYDKSTKLYMDEISKNSPLTKAEEEKLWYKYKYEGDEQAKNKLITSNLKFVAKIANKYRGRGLSYSDLIAEGNIGLIKSLDYFDEKKGNRVLSYAVWWIRQMMMEAISKRGGYTGDSLPEDMDTVLDDEYSSGNINGKGKKEIPSYESGINDNEITESVNEMMEILTEREQGMLQMYYGLNGERPCTLEEIGEEFGLTKERVRQINEKSIMKLRAYVLCKNVNEDIYNR